jgi:predicted transcriptional regulator
MTQVNLRIGDDQKDRWKSMAEKDDRTLTSFIQHCVETHPDYNDFQKEQLGGGLSPETAETINQIASRMDQLQNTVEGLDSRVSNIEGSIRSREQTTQDLAGEVFSGLPTEDMFQQSGDLGDFGTLEWIAEEMDESPRAISIAIEYLEDQHMVYSSMIEGSRRYFKD